MRLARILIILSASFSLSQAQAQNSSNTEPANAAAETSGGSSRTPVAKWIAPKSPALKAGARASTGATAASLPAGAAPIAARNAEQTAKQNVELNVEQNAEQSAEQKAAQNAAQNAAQSGGRANSLSAVQPGGPAPALSPPKVRIGLRLTPFTKLSTRGTDGQVQTRYVQGDPLRHTLRARLNQTNHFFVGEWHVETVPSKWIRKTRHYEVRLNIYRRYGAFGQLEENLGSMDLAGTLGEQEGNVHVLIGVARQRLRDKFGNPLLDVVAGFTPGTSAAAPGPTISLGTGDGNTNAPATPPPGYSGNLLRGRF